MIRQTILAAAAALTIAGGTVGSASAATAVSSNWSGYAVSGTTFSTVSGSWTQPAADCSSASSITASAFWVGLGGNSETSNALEQTGTEADCNANGTATYSAWYELVPAASVKAPLKVSAGDRISASVRVNGTKVIVQIRNLTTGKSFSKTLRMSAPDIASAEWVAEAPSALTPGGSSILPLTDFGTIRFTNASATSTSGHTGSISDSAWSATRIHLESGAGGGPGSFGPFAGQTSGTEAITSALSSGGSTFTVTWRQTTPGPPQGFGV
jgi:hypothetical protein